MRWRKPGDALTLPESADVGTAELVTCVSSGPVHVAKNEHNIGDRPPASASVVSKRWQQRHTDVHPLLGSEPNLQTHLEAEASVSPAIKETAFGVSSADAFVIGKGVDDDEEENMVQLALAESLREVEIDDSDDGHADAMFAKAASHLPLAGGDRPRKGFIQDEPSMLPALLSAEWLESAQVEDSRDQPPKSQKQHVPQSVPQAGPREPAASSDHALYGSGANRNARRTRRRAEKRGEDPQQVDGKRGGCVVLVREDCRLHDNPALHAAVTDWSWVVILYVHDDEDPSPWPVRGAGLWWRHVSLQHFDTSLRKLGNKLMYRRGRYIEQVADVLLAVQAQGLLFNRQLEPWHHKRDLELERVARECLGLRVESFKAMSLCFEPWDDAKSLPTAGSPEPLPAPGKKEQTGSGSNGKGRRNTWVEYCAPTVSGAITAPPDGLPDSLDLFSLGYGRTAGHKIPPSFRQFNEKRQPLLERGMLGPVENDWAYEMAKFWPIGEQAAMRQLEEWLLDAAWGCYFPPGLNPRDDAGGRFRADRRWTALLSPYLRFGDLSARYVYWRCREALSPELRKLFIKRVFWRDKAYAQLYKWPDSHTQSIRTQYDHQSWSGTATQLRRWQRGETGFPLVDAAMRQLWKVGWMCNHLRHVTAQFLIEHLDLSWKDGFAWYDYTLVDTDVAINAMMWQMGGHSGIGSWNFVMHPVFAGKKVDPEGAYVRRWLPELAGLPVEYIHCPWEAPPHTRISANVLINGVYWQRILEDLVAARLTHQNNVIDVRERFPKFVKKDGTEIVVCATGEVVKVGVRDDIKENDRKKITLMMTADDPRSNQRRKLASKNGLHTALIYDETKRFEAMYDAM